MADGQGDGVPMGDASDISRVRLNIGDTNSNNYHFTDMEISVFLSDASNNTLIASVYACEALQAEFAYLVTKSIADQKIQYSDLQKHFIDLADRLKARLDSPIGTIAAPYSGTVEAEKADAFTRGMHDYT